METSAKETKWFCKESRSDKKPDAAVLIRFRLEAVIEKIGSNPGNSFQCFTSVKYRTSPFVEIMSISIRP